jgi:hypothetical protein
VVGVEPNNFAVFASSVLQKQVLPSEVASVFADAKVRKAVIAELDRVANLRGLAGYCLPLFILFLLLFIPFYADSRK